MKPLIRFSILLLLGILAIPARASVPLVVPPPRAITALDSLRADAQTARSAGDFARAEELLRGILSRYPGDGFALRDAVLLAQEQDDEQIALKVAPKGPGLVGGVKPAPADLLFQRGLVAFYGEQSSTALAIFQEVTRLRPRWGWGLYYEARCRERLDQSRVEIDSVYQEALRDPDVAGYILYAALRRETDRLDGVRPREAAPLLKWIGAIPWLRGVEVEAAIADSLDFHPARLADFEALWRDARKRLGGAAGTLAEQLGYGACRTLSPPEAFRFIEAREREGLGVRDWRLARATYLDYYGLSRRAFATLESKGRGSTLWLRLALRRAIDSGTKDEALKLAARLDLASRDPEDVDVLQLAYRLYAEPEKAAALSESMARENPSSALYLRTHQSLPGDPRGLRALLDSLEATGSNFDTRIARLELREALGDTIPMAELDPMPAGGIALRVGRLADAALGNGNFDRVKQLWAYCDRRTGESWAAIRDRSYAAPLASDTSFSLPAARRALEQAPEIPWIVGRCLQTLARHGREAEALEWIERMVRDGAGDFELHQSLVAPAAQLKRPGLADTLLNLAAAAEPRSRAVRENRAWLLAVQGHRGQARTLLEKLLEEQPGRESARELLASLEGAPAKAGEETVATRDTAAGSDEYESTGWIRARAAIADTMRGDPIVHLAVRETYICDRLDSYQTRLRSTVRVQSADGIEAVRVMTIPFSAGDGVPRVLVARVIQPDGTILAVKPDEMVVTADKSEALDVTDSRALVIPMPGLKVGSIVDLAYVTTSRSSFGAKWSWLTYFAALAPVLESTIEVRARRGLPLVIRSATSTPAPRVSDEGDWTISRWTMENQPKLTAESSMDDWQTIFPWVGATTIGSWESAADLYRNSFWKQVEVTGDLKSLATRIVKGARTPGEKLDSLVGYVGQNVNYTAIEFDEGRVVPTQAKEVLKRGYGDCKGMVGLLIALSEAVGIEAWPVLVTTGGFHVVKEFVNLKLFDHMIVYFPGIEGGLFSDPTARPRRASDLPAGVAGRTGLTFGRTAAGRLVQLTPAKAEDHSLSMTIDLRPLNTSNEALFEVTGKFRGDAARKVERGLRSSDSSTVLQVVDFVMGQSMGGTFRREGWRVESRDRRTLTMNATYRDTAWSGGENELTLSLPTLVASSFNSVPPARDRRFPVRLEYPFADTVVVRLHGASEWEPSGDLAALQVAGPGYSGAYSSKRAGNSSDHWIEIRQQFEIRDPVFTREAYEKFHRDWTLYTAALYQPYRYRRRIDADQLSRVKAYAQANPGDRAFAVEAASKLLGGDAGGSGAEGKTRRAAARLLLEPHMAKKDQDVQARLLLSVVDMKEGRYRAADSLLVEARQLDRENVEAMAIQAALFQELGELKRTVEVLEEMQQKVGNERVLLWYISVLYRMGRDDAARKAEERYSLLASGANKEAVETARLSGLIEGRRCREARDAFAKIRMQDSTVYRMTEASLCINCGPLRRAVEILEEKLKAEPFVAQDCNNVAWLYARLGANLDRAETLAKTATLLDPENLSNRNTQAAVAWRAGKIAEARALLESMNGQDDRPTIEVYNGYFLGLCDWSEGRKEEAVRRWKRLLPRATEEAAGFLNKSLDLAGKGGAPGEGFYGE